MSSTSLSRSGTSEAWINCATSERSACLATASCALHSLSSCALPVSESRQHASVLEQTAHLSNSFQLHNPDAPPHALQPGMHTRLGLPAELEASACMAPWHWLSHLIIRLVTGSGGELVEMVGYLGTAAQRG